MAIPRFADFRRDGPGDFAHNNLDYRWVAEGERIFITLIPPDEADESQWPPLDDLNDPMGEFKRDIDPLVNELACTIYANWETHHHDAPLLIGSHRQTIPWWLEGAQLWVEGDGLKAPYPEFHVFYRITASHLVRTAGPDEDEDEDAGPQVEGGDAVAIPHFDDFERYGSDVFRQGDDRYRWVANDENNNVSLYPPDGVDGSQWPPLQDLNGPFSDFKRRIEPLVNMLAYKVYANWLNHHYDAPAQIGPHHQTIPEWLVGAELMVRAGVKIAAEPHAWFIYRITPTHLVKVWPGADEDAAPPSYKDGGEPMDMDTRVRFVPQPPRTTTVTDQVKRLAL